MKGIAHFVAGVAVASFFPGIVAGAAQNLSFGPLWGGLAGLLPDTLDFKFVRYFYRLDVEVDPGKITNPAGHPDPQAMAARVAAAIDRAYDTGKQVRLCLHTLRLGADLWRRYDVTFGPDNSQVVVRLGPVVSTGQLAYAGSEIPDLEPGRARLRTRVLPTYESEIQVDVFSGPALAFDRAGDAVVITFMPWHRRWTHSLAAVLLLGAVGFLIAPAVGLVMALAALAHIAADQLGHMGSSLVLPLADRRIKGLGWMRSGDAIPNFLAVWVSLACILLNLDRFSATPQIPVWPYVVGVIVVPCLFFLGLRLWAAVERRLPVASVSPATAAAVEALDETNEVDI